MKQFSLQKVILYSFRKPDHWKAMKKIASYYKTVQLKKLK